MQIDFTGVTTQAGQLGPGSYLVDISSAKINKSQQGNDMLSVTYSCEGGVAYDNFVLLPTTLWKLKLFLEALFNTVIDGQFNLDPKTIIHRKLHINVEEEEYTDTAGCIKTRARVLTDYKPASVTSGLVPEQAVTPTPVTPTFSQPQVNATVPAPTPAPVVTPQPQVQAQAPVVETTPVAPVKPKLPWE